MAWRRPGGKPLSEPMMVRLLGLNELRPYIQRNISNVYYTLKNTYTARDSIKKHGTANVSPL